MAATEREDARFAQLLIDRRMQCRADAILSTFAGATALGATELLGPSWHVYSAAAAPSGASASRGS